MMRFKNSVAVISFLTFTAFLNGCTSATNSSSIDDEMLAETEFSDQVFDESTGATADNSQPAEQSLDDFEFSEEDFADNSSQTAENLDEDFSDFNFDEIEGSQAQNLEQDNLDEQSLEDELNLDELQAEDVVMTPEPEPVPEEPSVEEFNLEDSFADAEPELEAPPAPVPAPEPAFEEPAPLVSQKGEVTDIRYVANRAGGSVVIDTSVPLTHQTRFNTQTGQYVVEIDGAILPVHLKRPFLMKDFEGSFGSINAYQVPDQNAVRVVVQLKPGFSVEPTVQTEGNSIVVVPPTASAENFQIAMGGEGESGALKSPGQTANSKSPSGPLAQRSLEEFLMSNQRFYGRPLSLQIRDGDVRDVISFIAEESGANIVMSESVKGNISLKLRKIPWDQALVTVMRTKGLGYVRQGSVIRIVSMDELKKETDTARDILKAQKEYAPVKVKVIPVNYAGVADLQTQLKEFLSPDGKIVADWRSNSILVTDREDVLEKVSRLIKALDVQPNQVMIEGKIVEASESFRTELGVRWGASGSPVTVSPSGGAFGAPLDFTPNMSFGQSGSIGTSSLGFRFGTLDFLGNLQATLQLAEQEQTAKVLSSPRVVAMNREKAEIGQVGEVISLLSTKDLQGVITTSAERTKVNLKLAVTPQITSDGVVMMDMDVTREFPGPEHNTITRTRPLNSRTAKTKVLVKDGETAVIGGIYQLDEAISEDGVPVLKDIPYLGWLFKTKGREKQKNELMIFLTPRIMASTAGSASPAL